jgi:hypothetical protein
MTPEWSQGPSISKLDSFLTKKKNQKSLTGLGPTVKGKKTYRLLLLSYNVGAENDFLNNFVKR